MRINAINACASYKLKNQPQVKTSAPQQSAPSFKGNTGKVVGGLVGLALVAAVCPAAIAIGLGGLGVLPGTLLGAAYDEKKENENSSSQPPSPSSGADPK